MVPINDSLKRLLFRETRARRTGRESKPPRRLYDSRGLALRLARDDYIVTTTSLERTTCHVAELYGWQYLVLNDEVLGYYALYIRRYRNHSECVKAKSHWWLPPYPLCGGRIEHPLARVVRRQWDARPWGGFTHRRRGAVALPPCGIRPFATRCDPKSHETAPPRASDCSARPTASGNAESAEVRLGPRCSPEARRRHRRGDRRHRRSSSRRAVLRGHREHDRCCVWCDTTVGAHRRARPHAAQGGARASGPEVAVRSLTLSY